MKENYQLKLESIINNLDHRPTLLLHSCCAPCSSYVLNYLNNYFDITIYYYNPNIYPESEYEKRLSEQVRLINELNDNKINIVKGIYEPNKFYDISKGLESDKEGSTRCHKCYELRLDNTALYGKENNYEYFTTTLSVSPYKNSNIINELGQKLEEKYNIKYLYADFKKKNGYKKSIEYSKQYNLYRQDYCGCEFSYKQKINE